MLILTFFLDMIDLTATHTEEINATTSSSCAVSASALCRCLSTALHSGSGLCLYTHTQSDRFYQGAQQLNNFNAHYT